MGIFSERRRRFRINLILNLYERYLKGLLQPFQYVYQLLILFRQHDAEPDKFSVKTLERGTVTDHHTLADTGIKYLERGQLRLDDL